MHIVIYREHGKLMCETACIGPFDDFGDAYEYLCTLPALGTCPEGENAGVKFVQELVAPQFATQLIDLRPYFVDGARIHHIDGNPMNNDISNLRRS